MLLALLTLLVAGCGSDKKTEPTTTLHLLPNAKTSDEWAQRIVNRFLTPLNRDLQVLTLLNNPDVRLYLAGGNQQTIGIVNRRMHDLRACTDKLVEIGPPTEDDAQFKRVAGLFKRACGNYEKVADAVLEAVPLIGSGRSDVIDRGVETLRDARDESEAAAHDFKRGVDIAAGRPEFKNAGLQSSS